MRPRTFFVGGCMDCEANHRPTEDIVLVDIWVSTHEMDTGHVAHRFECIVRQSQEETRMAQAAARLASTRTPRR